MEGRFRRMSEEIQKVRLSYVRRREDVMLPEGRHRFDTRETR